MKKNIFNDFDEIQNNEKEFKQENQQDIFNMSMEMDFSSIFDAAPEVKNIETSSSSDGLVMSLTTLGHVDIEYISRITNKTMEDVISDLKGSIFQNPLTWNEEFYKGWETKEEYLSGNLRDKYKISDSNTFRREQKNQSMTSV